MELTPDEQRKQYDAVIESKAILAIIAIRGCAVGHELNEAAKKYTDEQVKKVEKHYKGVGVAGILVGGALVLFLQIQKFFNW